jgi:16S rRNA (guanine1207-N2)-methyltransferase
MVARLFVQGSRPLLKRGGRFYIVTKMPTAVVPLIFEEFGDCSVIENRGYTIITAVV